MTVYWAIVVIPLLAALSETPGTLKRYRLPLTVLFVVLLFFMGFRETCGDYERYAYMYDKLEGEPLIDNLTQTESIYGLFNWLSAQFDLGIVGVNVLCAIVFLGCLFYAASREPLPFYFCALSIPYFVIVVGMGYTRQGVAAGLILLGLQSLRMGKPWHYAIQIALAAGFHASAFAVLPAVLFCKLQYRNAAAKFLVRSIVLLIGAYAFYGFFQEQYATYVTHYIESERYSSGGALLRSAVTFAAGIMFFIKRKDWKRHFGDWDSLWIFALGALGVFPLAFVASTPADRIGLYLIPFQLIVFARLPCLQRERMYFRNYQVGIAGCYALYFFVWLHLGTYSKALWVPYETALW